MSRLVYLVDIGAFLSIDLYVDEVIVHYRRGNFVLKRFVGHNVTPVA